MLVDLAQDIGRHDGEFVGAEGKVQILDDVAQRLVGDVDVQGIAVGLAGALVCAEVEEARVVFVVGFDEEDFQFLVDLLAFVGGAAQASVAFDVAVFGDAQEDDAVDGALDEQVELALAEVAVVQGDFRRQQLAPVFHLAQEGLVDAEGAADALAFGPFAQRALGDGFAAEARFDFSPICRCNCGLSNSGGGLLLRGLFDWVRCGSRRRRILQSRSRR